MCVCDCACMCVSDVPVCVHCTRKILQATMHYKVLFPKNAYQIPNPEKTSVQCVRKECANIACNALECLDSASVSCPPCSKHLQCRVNMEPTLERRRRLARGRVQKYRSIKRRRKGRSTDDVLPETACS